MSLDASGRANGVAQRVSSPLTDATGVMVQSFDLTARQDGDFSIVSRKQIAAEDRFTVELATVDTTGKTSLPTRLIHDADTFQPLTTSEVSVTATASRLRVDFNLVGQTTLTRDMLQRDMRLDHGAGPLRDLEPLSIFSPAIAPQWIDSASLGSGQTVTVGMDTRIVHGWITSAKGKILTDFRIDRDIPHNGGSSLPNGPNGEVAALNSGDFVVVWKDAMTIAGEFHGGIVARRYDSTGTPVGIHIPINSADGAASAPQIVALKTGGFLVAWDDYSTDYSAPGQYVVRAREFGPTGHAVGREFTIADDRPGGLDLALGDNGRVLATWQDKLDPTSYDTLARSVLIADEARDFAGVIQGNARANILTGTRHDDIINGQAGHDRLSGKGGRDDLRGGNGNDRLLGGAGNDLLDGGTGRDTLNGGSGDDVLTSGGRHRDIMTGGAGDDVFVFHKTGSRTEAVITDFNVHRDHLAMNGFGLENEYLPPFRQTKAGLLFEVTPRADPDNNYSILLEGVRRSQLDDMSISFF